MPAKNLISQSSLKVIKIALIRPRKNPISRNTNTHIRKTKLHPNPKNLIVFSKKNDPTQSSKFKSSRCFICKKKRAFRKKLSKPPFQISSFIEHLQGSLLLSNNDDVESLFSEQEDYDEQTTFVLTEDHSDPEGVSIIQTIQQIQKA